MTILAICQAALNEIGGVEVPASFYGSTNLTARQCVALLNREGQTLERENRWRELLTTATLTTVDGQANYDLPDDFRAFANMTQWDRSNRLPMIGPTPARVWQWLQSGIQTGGGTITRWFRLQGSQFYVYPTPGTDGDELVFDYYSKNWLTLATPDTSGNTTASAIASDNDEPRLDDALLTLGLKWRYLQAKGFPFQSEYLEYETIKTELRSDNTGAGMISLGRATQVPNNMPETGFGQ